MMVSSSIKMHKTTDTGFQSHQVISSWELKSVDKHVITKSSDILQIITANFQRSYMP